MKGIDLIRTVCFTLCLALGAVAGADEAPAPPSVVNINTADAATLSEVLDGVGVVKARAIVSYRERNGTFANAEALSGVKGIGAATVARNAERIRVEAAGE